MKKVFIDGGAGTTGLRIVERLSERDDLELIKLGESERKDISARKNAINSADIVFLCLPDDIARESVTLCENENVVIIDTSTAHRVQSGWTYGFPEIGNQREVIKKSKRISNPGCHASGFISLVYPLVEKGVISKNSKLSCFSVTGFSGGGKKMIAQYNESQNAPLLSAPRAYGLGQTHKHLPEMSKICKLENLPIFCPVVSDFYSGMEVIVPIFRSEISADINEIKNIYSNYYKTSIVGFVDNADEEGFISSAALSDKDNMQISVFGNDERILLVSRFDNLGKGASGAAIQNMNLVMGIDETTGLNI